MKYSSKEIVDMAVKIEDTGYAFYTACAAKFESHSKKAAGTFSILASEELKHRKYFQSVLSSVASREGVFDDTYYAYLQALTQVQVFKDASDITKVLASVTTVNDVLSIALQTEKDSIIWYKELTSFYSAADGETLEILDNLINEEKRHIVLIYDMMKDNG